MIHQIDDTNTFLTTGDLAARYGLTPESIRRWRTQGKGPLFYKSDKFAMNPRAPRIRYKLADVLAWEQTNNITPIN